MDYFAVFCHEYDYTNHLFRKSVGWRLVTRSLKKKLMGFTAVWTYVKVFEWIILLSSATNMVTQIIYLGRMEVGDWYYSFLFFVNIFLMGFTAVWT